MGPGDRSQGVNVNASAAHTPSASFAGTSFAQGQFPNASFATNATRVGPSGGGAAGAQGGPLAVLCRKQRSVAIVAVLTILFVAFISFQYTSGSGYKSRRKGGGASEARPRETGGSGSSSVMTKLNGFFKPSSKKHHHGGSASKGRHDEQGMADQRKVWNSPLKPAILPIPAEQQQRKKKKKSGSDLAPRKSLARPNRVFNSPKEVCSDPAEVRRELDVDVAPTSVEDLQHRLWKALTIGDSVADLAATKENSNPVTQKIKDHLRSLALVFVGDSTALRSFYGSKTLLSKIVEDAQKQTGGGGGAVLTTTYRFDCGENVREYDRVRLTPRFMWCAVIEEVKSEHQAAGGEAGKTATVAAFVAFYKVIWLRDLVRGMESLSVALLSSGSKEKDVELDDASRGPTTSSTSPSPGPPLVEVELLPKFVRSSLRSAKRRITLVWSVGLWDLVRPTQEIHGFDATQNWTETKQLANYQVYAADALSAAYRVVDSLNGHHFLLLVRPPPIVNCSAPRFTKVPQYEDRCLHFLLPEGLPMLQTMMRLILFNGDDTNAKLLLPTKGHAKPEEGAGDAVSPEHRAKEALGTCTFSDGVHADAAYGTQCFVSEQWSVWLHTFLGGGLC